MSDEVENGQGVDAPHGVRSGNSAPLVPAIDPLLGQTFVDKYAINKKLGEGGFGAVYSATQLVVDRPVAVKVLRPGIRDRFARVEGPSVVFSLLLGTAMIVLLVGGGAIWSIALFIVLFLLGFAAGPLLEPLVLMRAFGLSSYGTILGASFTLQALGLVVAPAAAGAVYDATDPLSLIPLRWLDRGDVYDLGAP